MMILFIRLLKTAQKLFLPSLTGLILILIMSGFRFPASGSANLSSKGSAMMQPEAGVCEECESHDPGNELRELMKRYEKLFSGWTRAADVEEINARMKWANQCNQFVKSDSYGSWGKTVVNELRSGRHQIFYKGTADIEEYCPDYKYLTDTQREDLWVLLINAMAQYESSCDNSAHANGPNGQARGILQLHLGAEETYASGCSVNDSLGARSSIRCAIHMLDKQFTGSNLLFDPKSYWDVLRPEGLGEKTDFIKSALSNLPICHPQDKPKASIFKSLPAWGKAP